MSISSSTEDHPLTLEKTFMAARQAFYASRGGRTLTAFQTRAIEQTLLKVAVVVDNLAWYISPRTTSRRTHKRKQRVADSHLGLVTFVSSHEALEE